MNLVERAKNLLLQPKAEWPVIEGERTTTQELYTSYVMILAAIGPVASLIGMSVFGIDVPFVGRIRTPLWQGLMTGVLTYGLSLVMLFVLSRIINWLAPTFGGLRDPSQAMKVAAYACTAAWVGGLFSLLPALSVFGLFAALYSLYLLYTGLPVLMKSSPDRSLGYVVSIVVITIVLMIPVTAVVMLLSPAVHRPMVSADPATNDALHQLESFTKGLERMGQDMERATQDARSSGARSTRGSDSGPSAGSSATTEPDVQQAVQTVGAVLTAMGKAANDGKSVEAADFRKLKALLPESIPGMERKDATGEREAVMGVDRSEAKATYVGPNDSRIVIEVVDIGGSLGTLGLAAFSWAATGAVIDKETAEGYERTVTYRGRKALEHYNRADQSGELSVLVNNHAGVTVRGRHVTADALRGALDQLDLDGVSSARAS